jgi:hypothetical protein
MWNPTLDVWYKLKNSNFLSVSLNVFTEKGTREPKVET